MLPAKLPSKQLQVIWYSVINSIIHQWWSGKCYCLLPKYLYLTRTWLKKYLMYLMSSKYSEYLNLYLYLQIWKSTCTWLKYFEKYLTPTLLAIRNSSFSFTYRSANFGKYAISDCPFICLSVCGQNHVRSVSSRILIRSISYLHILSSNFRMCVACKARFKIEILANFLNL